MNPGIVNDPALIRTMQDDGELGRLRRQLLLKTVQYRYCYNFSWCGRPVVQFPDDLLALQEVVWHVRPDLVVETGVAHGGSLIFYASLLEAAGGRGHVVGVDLLIRPPNRRAIEQHPLSRRISLIEGSSTSPETVRQVYDLAQGRERVLVVLDSDHTHAHVLQELRHYSPLVRRSSYVVVLDTAVADLPAECFHDRPWGPGNNPRTAVQEFLRESDRFRVDGDIQSRLLLSAAPDGYLECVED